MKTTPTTLSRATGSPCPWLPVDVGTGNPLANNRKRPARGTRHRGVTLMEVLIALFIFMVGIVGVLAAIPTGINSAEWVIFQDAALHLSHSKFSEFRRDRADPFADLNGFTAAYQDFAHAAGETYFYFDDIDRYEWKLELQEVQAGDWSTQPAGTTAPTGPHLTPAAGGGASVGVQRVTVLVHMKGTTRELRFTQYMTPYGPL